MVFHNYYDDPIVSKLCNQNVQKLNNKSIEYVAFDFSIFMAVLFLSNKAVIKDIPKAINEVIITIVGSATP